MSKPVVFWNTSRRRLTIQRIATEIGEMGRKNRHKHKVEISAHVLEDWSNRLHQLLYASSVELDRNHDEILLGNPAKYQ